jgi:hypothetical protein
MSVPSPRRSLPRDPQFRADQSQIALFVAQLDDQWRRLGVAVEGLGAADLEWQPGPGRNSAGMLLAHNAVTEVFWTGVARGVTHDRAAAETYCREILGIGLADDGMPASEHGGHPAALASWELHQYVELLRRARFCLKDAALGWRDDDLATIVPYASETAPDRAFTREWILYHLLEHYAQHTGQVGLVLALRRASLQPRDG